jgi:uncharacterized protein (TIGR03437 family)
VVTIDNKPAPLLYVGATQINAQVPSAVASSSASGTVAVNGSVIARFTIPILPTSPAFFGSPSASPVVAGSVLTSYLTGQGAVTPAVDDGTPAPVKPLSLVNAPVTAVIGNQSADVLFAGLSPGLVGVFQVNFRVPDLAAGSYNMVIQVGGVSSRPVQISVIR